tara:strand:+ start:575 stop:1477 length:903 start_codon:yes stop_codon:yes gene_type:complete
MIVIDNPSQEEFKKYLNKEEPFKIINVMDKWEAYKKWNESFFVKKYGDKKFRYTDLDSKEMKIISCEDYFNYLSSDSKKLLYLRNVHFEEIDENLYDDYDISLVNNLDFFRNIRKYEKYIVPISQYLSLRWIFIGKKNTYTNIHRDIYSTTAWLGLISGKKKFYIYNKYQTQQIDCFLINNKKDIDDIDFEKLNSKEQEFFDTLTPSIEILNPGEIIITPNNLYHYVKNLENSIAITENFSYDKIDNEVLESIKNNEEKEVYNYVLICYYLFFNNYYIKIILSSYIFYLIIFYIYSNFFI